MTAAGRSSAVIPGLEAAGVAPSVRLASGEQPAPSTREADASHDGAPAGGRYDIGRLWCTKCHADEIWRLFVPVGDRERLCTTCWNKAGRPFIYPSSSLQDVAAAEGRIRAAMVRRGGAERHHVNKGLT